MTRAYSAGAGKIAENMYVDCKQEDFHEKYGITQKDCNKFAKLLVKAIYNVWPWSTKHHGVPAEASRIPVRQA